MKIFATTLSGTHGYAHSVFQKWVEAAGRTPETDASQADVILFIQDGYIDIRQYIGYFRNQPLLRQHADNCFIYSPYYKSIPLLPGLYPAAKKDWIDKGFLASHYCADFHPRAPEDISSLLSRKSALFSFAGRSSTADGLRSKIFALSEKSAILRNTDGAKLTPGNKIGCFPGQPCDYCVALWKSKFSLCPRGYGPSSYRVFESMEWAAVPVIISDQWQAPEGPDWSTFSIRVAEREVDRLPEILRGFEPRFEQMAVAARKNWETWFSPSASLRTVERWLSKAKSSFGSLNASERLMFRLKNLSDFHHWKSLASDLMRKGA